MQTSLLVLLVLVCFCEALTLTDDQRRQLDSFVTTCLWCIFGPGSSGLDQALGAVACIMVGAAGRIPQTMGYWPGTGLDDGHKEAKAAQDQS